MLEIINTAILLAALCILLVSRYGHERHGGEVRFTIMLYVTPGQTAGFGPTNPKDKNGLATTFPDGTTFAWSVAQTGGDGDFGTAAPNPDDPLKGIFVGGTAGATGYIIGLMTLPDGSQAQGQSAEFGVAEAPVPGPPVSFDITLDEPAA